MARKHILVLIALAALAAPAFAADTKAIVGGAIGGGAGAGVGSALGGQSGAIIGGALGGAAGAAIATSGNKTTTTNVVTREVLVEKEVVYVNNDRHPGDNGRHRGHHKNKHRD